MNAVRRKYQTPLQRISQVSSSPNHKKPSNAPNPPTSTNPSSQLPPPTTTTQPDPLSMGQSYSSYYRIKQQKQQQQRLHYRQELRQKQQQIDKLKQQVIQLKMTISELENRLEEYKYPAACDLGVVVKAFEVAKGWLVNGRFRLSESRMFLFRALMEYFRKRDKRQFVYGRLVYWMLGVFEVINGQREQEV